MARRARRRSFNESKVRRGRNGRFIDKPDVPKVSRASIRKQSQVLNSTKQAAKVYKARLEVLGSLTTAQRVRLSQAVLKKPEVMREVAKRKPRKPRSAPEVADTHRQPQSTPRQPQSTSDNPTRVRLTKNDKKALKDYALKGDLADLTPEEVRLLPNLKLFRVYDLADVSKVEVSDKGIKLPRKYKEAKDFKVSENPEYKYSVTVDGKEVQLNNYKTTMEYKGETIHGVPRLHPEAQKMPSDKVAVELVRTMGYVESPINPPSPDWGAKKHGTYPKEYISPKGLGKMQIHHIDQWSQDRFDKITAKVDRGELTEEQGKAEFRKLLRPTTDAKSGYEIDIKGQGSREFVILAGGVHDVTSPLYFANHPVGIHPDTGERMPFGIPKKAQGGRDEFNKFRPAFWREYYKHEATLLASELSERIKAGKLTTTEAQKLLQDARNTIDKQRQGQLELRGRLESRNLDIQRLKDEVREL